MMLLAGVAALGLAASATTSWAATTYGPDNTVTVVDPSPVNWLSVTWNTMEEANRVDMNGKEQHSLATAWKWVNPIQWKYTQMTDSLTTWRLCGKLHKRGFTTARLAAVFASCRPVSPKTMTQARLRTLSARLS